MTSLACVCHVCWITFELFKTNPLIMQLDLEAKPNCRERFKKLSWTGNNLGTINMCGPHFE